MGRGEADPTQRAGPVALVPVRHSLPWFFLTGPQGHLLGGLPTTPRIAASGPWFPECQRVHTGIPQANFNQKQTNLVNRMNCVRLNDIFDQAGNLTIIWKTVSSLGDNAGRSLDSSFW